MQFSEQESWIDVDGQKRERRYADAILNDHHCQASTDERGLFPERTKGEVRNEHRENQKCNAGSNPAAFPCDFNAHSGQMEDESFSKSWNAGQIEHSLCDCGRSSLENINCSREKEFGKRHRKQQKRKREPEFLELRAASDSDEPTRQHENQRQGVPGQPCARAQPTPAHAKQCQRQRREEENQCSRELEFFWWGKILMSDINKPPGDQRDQKNVRRILVRERELDQGSQWVPKQGQACGDKQRVYRPQGQRPSRVVIQESSPCR